MPAPWGLLCIHAMKAALLILLLAPTLAAAQGAYTGADILSPAADEGVRANAGEIWVQTRITPALRKGHQVRLLLDGLPYGQAQKSPRFHLVGLDRGTHALQVQVVDAAGRVVFAGVPGTFHLLRHSRAHPRPAKAW